jgi:hypothetical protein
MVLALVLGGLAVLPFGFVGGCGRPEETYDTILSKRITCYNNITAALKPVVDKPTAQAARPELEKLIAEAEEQWNRQDEMKWPPPEEGARLHQQYGAGLSAALDDMKTQHYRVALATIPGLEDLLPRLHRLVNRGL